jgi:hypothetical protein
LRRKKTEEKEKEKEGTVASELSDAHTNRGKG